MEPAGAQVLEPKFAPQSLWKTVKAVVNACNNNIGEAERGSAWPHLGSVVSLALPD